MSIITMATTKGGAGKTTLGQLIIGAVHNFGYTVGVIDTDENGTLHSWLEDSNHMAIESKHITDETKIVAEAKKLDRKYDMVVIDTAGIRNQATIFAVGCADLVLIPVQMSKADVVEAVKTYKLVRSAGAMAEKIIPARVVFTDYTPKTNVGKQVRKKVSKHELPAMKTRLHHLVAYKAGSGNVRAGLPALHARTGAACRSMSRARAKTRSLAPKKPRANARRASAGIAANGVRRRHDHAWHHHAGA